MNVAAIKVRLEKLHEEKAKLNVYERVLQASPDKQFSLIEAPVNGPDFVLGECGLLPRCRPSPLCPLES